MLYSMIKHTNRKPYLANFKRNFASMKDGTMTMYGDKNIGCFKMKLVLRKVCECFPWTF